MQQGGGGAVPEQELESTYKGPEIIVPLNLLKRVESEAAKNLESWGVKVKSKELSSCLLRTGRMSALVQEIFQNIVGH